MSNDAHNDWEETVVLYENILSLKNKEIETLNEKIKLLNAIIDNQNKIIDALKDRMNDARMILTLPEESNDNKEGNDNG